MILVTRCLHLWIVKFGQYMSSLSIWCDVVGGVMACLASGWLAHLLECFRVIFGKRDLLPHLGGRMCAFDRLDVEV